MKRPHFSQFTNSIILPSRNYALVLLCLFFISLSNSIKAQVEVSYSTNGTFTVPVGVTSLKVECWGAGGKGSDYIAPNTGTGGGGGGGAYSSSVVCVIPGENYAINIGVGGNGATQNGGDTYFGNSSLVMAKGGNGLISNTITGAAGGLASASVGQIKYNGGNGGDRSTYSIVLALGYRSGAGGGGAGSTGNGNNAVDQTPGAVKNDYGGSGGAGIDGALLSALGGFTGNPGTNYGAGGGGAGRGLLLASSSYEGGSGASGYIRITYESYVCRTTLNTTWNGSGWSNGTPTACKKAIIDGNYNTATNGNIVACSCQVNSGKTLTIADSNHLELYNEIVNNGIIEVANNASLVQWYSTNSNSGNVKVYRNAKPMKRYDYTYWSSPVTGQTLYNLSPTTLFDKYFSWNPAGSWTAHNNGAATMQVGKGYIVRAPQSFPVNTTSNFTGIFTGAPNNGEITVPGFQGSTTTEVWNLIGNPYPSAIDVDLFLTDPDNSEVGGTVYLWTHNTPPSEGDAGLYTYTANDYATYNLSGGVATALPATNATDPGDNTNVLTNGNIASGQAFFIQGIKNFEDLEAGNVPIKVKFKNSMRIVSSNSNFFKPGPTTPVENWQTTGKHRFWINLRNEQGAFNQALIGYIENATNGLDRLYDGELFGGNYVALYSLLDQNKLTIQGKSLPFNNEDIVPLGYKVTIAGTFNISLDHFDGLFEGQDIFIRDKVLNLVHNLKDGAYIFTSVIGTFDDRFEIVYENVTLDVDTPQVNPESIVVYKNTTATITVNAGLLTIDRIRVYDITGRLLYGEGTLNTSEFLIQNLPNVRQVLIVEVLTTEGTKIAKKIIY